MFVSYTRGAEIDKRFPGLLMAIVNSHNIQTQSQARTGSAAKRKPVRREAGSKGIRTTRPDAYTGSVVVA